MWRAEGRRKRRKKKGEIRGRRTRLTTKVNAEIQYREDREFIAEAKSDAGIEFS